MSSSSFTYVAYWLPYDGDTEEHPNLFLVKKNIKSISLSDIKACFPLPGTYFFRAKQSYGKTHVWLDLNDDGQTVPTFQSKIHLKVSRLSFDEGALPARSSSSASRGTTATHHRTPVRSNGHRSSAAPFPVSTPSSAPAARQSGPSRRAAAPAAAAPAAAPPPAVESAESAGDLLGLGGGDSSPAPASSSYDAAHDPFAQTPPASGSVTPTAAGATTPGAAAAAIHAAGMAAAGHPMGASRGMHPMGGSAMGGGGAMGGGAMGMAGGMPGGMPGGMGRGMPNAYGFPQRGGMPLHGGSQRWDGSASR